MKKSTLTTGLTCLKDFGKCAVTERSLLLLLIFSFTVFGISAQNHQKSPKPKVIEPEQFSISAPLREIAAQSVRSTKFKEGESDREIINYPFKETALPKGPDKVWQKEMGTSDVKWNPTTNFEGMALGETGTEGVPPDTQGDVGPNHYFQVVNTAYQIWDKEGNSLVGPSNLKDIWIGFNPTYIVDPIVLYDDQADRWFVSVFKKTAPYKIYIAVSVTGDPTGSWYRWSYGWATLPDYAKYGVWQDGYYFGLNSSGYDVGVFDRNALINGSSGGGSVSFDNPYPTNGFCILPFDNDGGYALSGAPGQFITFNDDAWSGSDQLWIYQLSVDWNNPYLATFNRTQTIDVTPFDSNMGPFTVGVSQPGTTQKLATVSNQLMFRAQYRKFDTHESLVCSHTVDVDNTDHAGIRWYELRRTGGNWWVYQESTYAPDSDNRFVCSIAMNGNGDMALGYSVASSSVYPSIRYTGRKVSDPLSSMAIPEGEIFEGSHSQTNSDRWGDYACMSVDPSDDVGFWFTTEYSNGGNSWRTRIAKINLDNPVYCAASGSCDEFISRVQMGSIDNSSGCSNYADYTTMSTSFPVNGSQLITVTNGPPNYWPDECGIWVDWNLDGDFYDANEQISVTGTPGYGPYTATISPPYGVSEGFYTVRIRIKYNSGLDPCGTTTYGEVEDYSIELTPKVANYWTGASNSYWYMDDNWSLGHKPTPDEDVFIPNVVILPPIISVVNEECNNLTINTGAWVYIMETNLTINGNLAIFGKLSMVDNNGGIICHGDVDWNNNSTADFTASSLFQVYGHWFFNSGSNAQLNNGTVNFIGPYLSEVKSKSATSSFNSIYINKDYSSVKIISDASQPLVINGDINIQSNSGLSNDSGQDIICRGNFYNSGYYYLADASYQSTFVFDGADQYIYMFSANGYFNHLKISPGVSVTLGGGIHTAGDLTIESGVLDTQGNNIIVEGNWTNSVGPDAFLESSGRVIFSGSNIQYCSNEIFNELEIDNPPGAIYIAGTNVICNAYDWTAGAIDVFNGGTFTANDLIDDGIYGTYILSDANSTINLTNTDGYVDINGEIYINGGTMNVYGGTTPSYWPWDANAHISMADGVLDFHDQGIYIYDTPTYSLTENITGGIIRTAGGFIGERADFTPSSGTFEFYGINDFFLSQANGCTLPYVNIDKGTKATLGQKAPAPIIDKRSKKIISDGGKSNTSTLGSDFVITNTLEITSGELKLGGYGLSVGQDCWVYGTLTMDNSTDILTIGQNFWNQISFYSGSVANLANGTLNCYGWVIPQSGCSFNASTNNTIVIKGINGGGVSNFEPTATYGNIILDKNANQKTYIDYNATEPIIVNGTFTINPNNILITQVKTLVVHGDFTDQASSEIYAYVTTKSNGPGSSLQKPNGLENSKTINGALEIDSDFTLNGLMDLGADGMVVVHGVFGIAVSGSLIIDGGSFIADGPNHPSKGWEYYNGNLSISDGLFEVTNNSLSFGPTTTTTVSGGIIRIGGAFHASFPSTPGIFVPTGGVVELIGNAFETYVYCPTGNSFYNLRINSSFGITMTLNSPSVSVTNDVTIDGGHFKIGSLDNIELLVGGNWSDNVVGGLFQNAGTVVFNGPNPSTILTNETFYNLAVDKTYTGTDGLNIIDGLTVSVRNNLDIYAGGLTLGNSTLDVAQHINLWNNSFFGVPPSDVPVINVGGNWNNWNTANTSTIGFSPGMSTVSFVGTSDQQLNSTAGTETFYELSIDNGPNVLFNFTNIECLGDFHAISGNIVDNYGSTSDGHSFWSDFIIEQNANVDFDSHIIDFFGSNDAVFRDYSGNAGNTSNYGATVFINKDSPATLLNFIGDNTTGLSIGSTIIVNQGYVSPLTPLTCNGGIFVYDGTMHIGEAIVVNLNNGIEVNTGGAIEILGSALNPAMIKNTIGGSYSFDIKTGGEIRAENAVFQGMGFNGINIENGAYIDPAYSFNNCTFQDFVNPATSSSMLTIDNDQALTITGAVFPDNASAAFNVAKNVNQGQITFVDYTGSFSGPAFESDPYNLIEWFELELSVNPTVINVDPPAGTETFDITSNVDWTISESIPWLSLSSTSGSGNQTITITYDENTSDTSRLGVITISGDGVSDVSVSVNQAGTELTVTPSVRNVSAATGITTFDVSSNTTWTVAENVSWFTVTPMSGSNNGTLTVTYDENTFGTPRSGDIMVSTTGQPDVTVMVNQEGTGVFDLDLTVYLEGPFKVNEMSTDLNPALIPLNQPYNTAPWNYAGSENITGIPNANVVDWVLVELRDATSAAGATNSTRLSRQAAFLLKDGSVVGTDGSSPLSFAHSISNSLFVVTWHRNHLGIMSANPLTESGGVYSYDFTTNVNQAYLSGQKSVNGKAVMFGGDADANGTVNTTDKNIWWGVAGTKGYVPSDMDMDSQVDNKDKNDIWKGNLNEQSKVPN